MAANTEYLIRAGKRERTAFNAAKGRRETAGGYSWLAYLGGGEYGWTQRAKAKRYVGRKAADEAAAALRAAMLAKGYSPPVAVVPARGGAPCGKAYFSEGLGGE